MNYVKNDFYAVRASDKSRHVSRKGGCFHVIDVTLLNGKQITVNAEIIEVVDEVPDTVITLTTGRKIIVKESRQKVKSLVKSYKRDILNRICDEDET